MGAPPTENEDELAEFLVELTKGARAINPGLPAPLIPEGREDELELDPLSDSELEEEAAEDDEGALELQFENDEIAR